MPSSKPSYSFGTPLHNDQDQSDHKDPKEFTFSQSMLKGSPRESKLMNPERSPSSEEDKSMQTPQLGRNQNKIWMQHIVRNKIIG